MKGTDKNTNQTKSAIHEDAKILSEIGQKIISCLSVGRIISTVYEEVNTVMDATSMNLGIFNKETNRLEFPGTMERGEKLDFHWADLNETNKLPVVCFTQEIEIFANDLKVDAKKYTGHDPVSLSDDGEIVEALIYIPLYSKEICLGVISVQSFHKNTYTEYHLDLLKNIGNYVGIAIENAQLYEKMEKEIQERTSEVTLQKENLQRTFDDVKLLNKIGQKITTCLSIEEIVEEAYDSINKLMDASVFAIGIYNKKEKSIVFPSIMEEGKRLPSSAVRLSDNMPACWCFNEREEIILLDRDNPGKRNFQKVVIGKDPNSLVYFPLKAKSKTIGVITVQSFQKNAYKPYQLEMLRNIAVFSAIAIENAKSFENLATLSRIGKNITSSLDIKAVLETLYESVNKLMDAPIFLVTSYNKETNIMKNELCIENGKQLLAGHEIKITEERSNFSSWIVHNKKDLIIRNNAIEHKKYIDSRFVPGGENPLSLIFIPLIVERNIIGMISVQSMNENAYSNYEVELLRTLASYVSGALNNAFAYKELEAARKEMEQLSIVASETDNAVIIMDEKGRFEWVNKAYTRMTGYTLETLINECSDNLGTINHKITNKHFNKVLKTKSSVSYELTFLKRDKKPIWIQTNLSPVLDKEGNITKLIAIDSDITATKENQLALAQSHKEYEALFSQIADSIFIFDVKTLRFLDCNKAMLDTYGYSKEEILKMTPFDLHPKWEKDVVKKSIHSDKGRSRTNEYYHLTKSGKQMVVEVRSENFIYRGVDATLSIVRDITERKEFEDKILNQNTELEKLSIVASETDNAVIIMDANGNFEWVNKAYEKMSGYDLEGLIDVIGKSIRNIEDDDLQRNLDKVYKDKKSVSFESHFTSKNGEKTWVQTNISPVLNSKNEIVKLVALDSNITQQKKAELKIREKNKDITDSINYASRIQRAMLPSANLINELLPNSFILYKPRDIVSGDFYWLSKGTDNSVYVAVVDCTGHGVPGAFLTIVGNNLLNQIVNFNKITDPGKILELLNLEILDRFESKSGEVMKDGMDMSLCKIIPNKNGATIEFSGAKSSIYHVSKAEMTEIPGNPFAIGTSLKNSPIYETRTISIAKGDTIYLSTDGYQDQFGGPRCKKFKKGNFNKTLLETSNQAIEEQRSQLNDIIEEWRGKYQQVDDILVLGIAF